MAELKKGQSWRDATKEENNYGHFSNRILSSSDKCWSLSVQSLQQGQGHTGWARFKAKAVRPPSRAHSKASLILPHFNFLDPQFLSHRFLFELPFPPSYFSCFWASVLYFLLSVSTFLPFHLWGFLALFFKRKQNRCLHFLSKSGYLLSFQHLIVEKYRKRRFPKHF